MKTQARIMLAMLGTLAFVQAPSVSAGEKVPPNVLPSEIYDPLGLVKRNAPLVIQAEGFGFTEGPAVNRKGDVFFTDQPNDRIYKWDYGTGRVKLFLQGTGRANGMYFDDDGNLIAAADLHGELWKIRPDGSHTVLINNYNGKLLNGPNDLWINPTNGGIYITDPIFPRPYWDAGDPRACNCWPPTHSEQAPQGKGGHVYYLAKGASALVRVTSDALGWESDAWPNGVVGTPDGKKLYVNKWAGDNKGGTWVFDVNADGTLSNMRKFTDWGGDGMSMDEWGNIYISNGQGVLGFDPNGNNILRIPTGSGATNNVFAGKDGKTLFITGPVDKVTAIRMNVRGAEYGWHGHDRSKH